MHQHHGGFYSAPVSLDILLLTLVAVIACAGGPRVPAHLSRCRFYSLIQLFGIVFAAICLGLAVV